MNNVYLIYLILLVILVVYAFSERTKNITVKIEDKYTPMPTLKQQQELTSDLMDHYSPYPAPDDWYYKENYVAWPSQSDQNQLLRSLEHFTETPYLNEYQKTFGPLTPPSVPY